MLNLDLSRASRYPSELVRLVEAVYSASPHDESDWIEWKSQVDLNAARAIGMMAQNILAFANRMPASASLYAEGHGYLLLGVEPGNLVGVEGLDLASLIPKVATYVDPRVIWRVEYVTVQGATVLVVIVDPPQPGAPIFTLQRQAPSGHHAGTVFVRRQAASVPASPQDIANLTSRAAASRGLDVILEIDHGLEVEPDLSQIDRLVAARRAELLGARYEPDADTDESRALRAARAELALYSDEEWTYEQYEREIDAYSKELAEQLHLRLAYRRLVDPGQYLRLRLRSDTDQHYARTRLTIHLSDRVGLAGDFQTLQFYLRDAKTYSLPFVPDPHGTPGARRHMTMDRDGMGAAIAAMNRPEPQPIPLGWVATESGEGLEVTFDEVDVRAGVGQQLPPVYVVVFGNIGDTVTLSWSLTSADTSGVQQGTMALGISPSSVDVEALCAIDEIFNH
ncbi:helix-turn-helix domain-containing protein [Micromonospora fulviviridis]|uniref:helix-turn-helix domain-containing protein n=1 Tax=Micromonospora fulviviridis TaxID=47860 RepID=UPI00379DDC06